MSHASGASVVIATYNAARFLPETLESVLAQDHRPLEVVLVDDGSTDDTRGVIGSLLGDRLRYISEPHSGGPSRPRNIGIRRSTHETIFIFDSDDMMLPGKVSRAMDLFERAPHVGLVFTDFITMNEQGTPDTRRFLESYRYFQRLPKERIGEDLYTIPGNVAHEALVFENFVGTSSVAMRSNVLREMSGFDESLTNAEDHELWLRIARCYDLGYVDMVGHRYRRRHDSILGCPASELAPNRIEVFRRELDRGLSAAASRAARRLIAANYFALGYEQRCLGRLRSARSYYLLGLREDISWPLVKGLVRTLLTPEFRAQSQCR